MKQTVTWGLAPHVGSYFMFKRLPIIGVAYKGGAILDTAWSELFKNGGDAK